VTLLIFPKVTAREMNKGSWFDKLNLILTGVYYYPEHWNENQWERDFKKMHELGFEFTHFAEFSWAQLEPAEGKYSFDWLDRAIALASKYNLKVIMCTSTATPPVWLVRKFPQVLLRWEDGTMVDHGARQHAAFTSSVYKRYAFKMIEKLAQHYGNDPRIIGWQLDNEPAVQFDYSNSSQKLFRDFLRKKYENNISKLNDCWGTAFWSQVYSTFNEITLPKIRQPLMNPHQILDYRRFAALQTSDFLDSQSLIIKKYSKNQWITSNYIPSYADGHIGKSKQLDFVSYTRYMVHGEETGIGDQGFRIGNPLSIAFANDFFRSISGTYGVMELQPGQVNWGNVNPQPYPGAVRLWLWSVFAGGSDFVCTYRFRQPLYGTEQYHNAIIGTDGVNVTAGGYEFEKFINEIKLLRQNNSELDNTPESYLKRKTGILFNPENLWNIERQKQNSDWNTMWHIGKYYKALKSFGAPVDFISESSDFDKYPVIIAPAYQLVDSALVIRWTKYVETGGNLILTCRTAQKDKYGRLFESPLGSIISKLTGNKLDFFDLLPSGNPGKVEFNNVDYRWNTWGEILIPDKNTEVWANYKTDFYQGKPAVTFRRSGNGSVTYIGVDTENGSFEYEILKKLYQLLNIQVMNLPYGVNIEYRNGFGVVMNYSDKPYNIQLPSNTEIIIGNKDIKPADVLVFKL
jgi:beta-galactosidase